MAVEIDGIEGLDERDRLVDRAAVDPDGEQAAAPAHCLPELRSIRFRQAELAQGRVEAVLVRRQRASVCELGGARVLAGEERALVSGDPGFEERLQRALGAAA